MESSVSQEQNSDFIMRTRKDLVESVQTKLADYLAEMIFCAMRDTGADNMEKYMEMLFLSGQGQGGEGNPVLTWYKVLKEGAGEELRHEIEKTKAGRGKEGNPIIAQFFRKRISEVPPEERTEYYHNLLINLTDFSAVDKIYKTFASDRKTVPAESPEEKRSKEPFRKSVEKQLKGSLRYNLFVKKIRKSTEIRNEIAHLTEANREKIQKETFGDRLDECREVADCFRPEAGSSEAAEKRRAFLDLYEKNKARLTCPPLSLEELRTIPDLEEATLLDPVLRPGFMQYYDKEKNELLFTSREEVELWVRRNAEQRKAGDKALAEAAGEPLSSGYPAFRPFPAGERLPAFSQYRGGHLTPEQLAELAETATFLADADFWLDRSRSKFLRKTVGPLMASRNRRMAVDWDSRVELFRIEKNMDGQRTPEEQKAAKQAHNTMTLMHESRLVCYLPREEMTLSSNERILRIVQAHPDCAFVLFTSNAGFCRLLREKGVRNVVPLVALPGMDCKVLRDNMPMVDAFLNRDGQEAPPAGETVPPKKPEPAAAPAGNPRPAPAPRPANRPVSPPAPRTAADGCILDSGEKLTVNNVPGRGDTVSDSHGGRITLREPLGRGGEGTIFKTDDPDTVVKIYHADKLTVNRRDKLQAMVENPPRIRELCWPDALVYNGDGAFCGYTMPSASGYEVLDRSVLLLADGEAQKIMPGWDRNSLVSLCIELCRIFELMGRRHILMGDINPKNIMVRTDSPQNILVRFVDCDSYQFMNYPCPVGTAVFTSPEIYKRQGDRPSFSTFLRTGGDESYAIASLLFHILMLNQSPFAGKGITDVTQAIREYNFAFRLDDKENTGAETPDGPSRLIWNNTPKYVKEAFGKVFKNGETVPTAEWESMLRRYQQDIQRGTRTSELKPERYWDTANRDYTKDFVCYECHRRGLNMPNRRYDNDEYYNLPHLCNRCLTEANKMKQTKTRRSCQLCGRAYELSEYEAYLIDENFREARCPACREKIREIRKMKDTPAQLVCQFCHNTYNTTQYEVYRLQNGQQKYRRCPTCQAERNRRFGK